MVTYTKRDIVRTVADKMDVPLNQAEPWVENVIDSLRDKMMAADPTCRIELRNFGVFEIKETKARNPKTNEVIYVPAHRKTHFKPSKKLKKFLKKPLSEVKEEA